jgi:hypothetical protein
MIQEWLQDPLIRGAFTGALAAAYVDFAAFRQWKSWNDATAYAWGVATFRWTIGGLIGLITAVLGLPAGSL